MRRTINRFVTAATLLAVGALAGIAGCASNRSAQVYTYDAAQGRNVVASDALGARMMRSETYRQAMLAKKGENLASVGE